MRYSKLPSDELSTAAKEAKSAIQHGQEFLKRIPHLPKSKALRKVSSSAAKIIQKLERQAEKLERANERSRLAALGKPGSMVRNDQLCEHPLGI
jgi:hypothetical protein